MSLVPPNFEELSNPLGSHMSHRAKSWLYQYSASYYDNFIAILAFVNISIMTNSNTYHINHLCILEEA